MCAVLSTGISGMQQGGAEKPVKAGADAERREHRKKERLEQTAAERAAAKEQRRRQAELELLLLDEHALQDQAIQGRSRHNISPIPYT